MKNENVTNWSEEIKAQEEQLKKEISYLNVYQKLSFFEDYFDKDKMIQMKMLYSNTAKAWSVLYINGYRNNIRENLFCNVLIEKSINPYFCPIDYAGYTNNDEIWIENNDKGYDDFLKVIWNKSEVISDYRRTLLERTLSQPEESSLKRRSKI